MIMELNNNAIKSTFYIERKNNHTTEKQQSTLISSNVFISSKVFY